MFVPFDSKEGQEAFGRGIGRIITEEDAKEALVCMKERFGDSSVHSGASSKQNDNKYKDANYHS